VKPLYDVAIVGGCGHIGLPLGLILADAGFDVVLIDTDPARRASVSAGEMPFMEFGAQDILTRVVGKTLHVSAELSDVGNSEHIVVTVGTPVDEYLNPKLVAIIGLFEAMRPHLNADKHLMLRSTLFPGTTSRIARLLAGWDIDAKISFCPERITQGNAIEETGAFPQLISGINEASVAAAKSVFDRINVPTIEVKLLEAELGKLFTNAFRYIQFGVANQFYMVAEQHGVSFDGLYRAMTEGYDRLKGFSRPGFAAGPCLLKDTMQLAAFAPDSFQLGTAAMRANEGLPEFLVNQIVAKTGSDLVGKKVGILGMAFKAECDDIRDALQFKLGKNLRFRGAEVLYSDEYFKHDTFVTKEELLEKSDIIVVGVPHKAYRGLPAPAGKLVVDLWNALAAPVAA